MSRNRTYRTGYMENNDRKKICCGPRAEDLSGRTFGKLTVVSRAENRGGLVCWHCRCACGSEKDVTAHDLKNGKVKSCGCLRRNKNIQNLNKNLHYTDGTCLEFLAGRKNRSDNTSGRKGVSRIKDGRYRAYIDFKGKRYALGTYPDFESAANARQENEDLLHKGFTRAYAAWERKADEDPSWAKAHPFVYEAKKQNGKLCIITSLE